MSCSENTVSATREVTNLFHIKSATIQTERISMKKTALLFTLFCTVLLTAEAGTTLRLVPLFRGCSYYWRGEASGTVTPFFRAIDSTR